MKKPNRYGFIEIRVSYFGEPRKGEDGPTVLTRSIRATREYLEQSGLGPRSMARILFEEAFDEVWVRRDDTPPEEGEEL